MLRPLGMLHILVGQQNLGHRGPILAEEFIVNVHHLALAHRRHGLLHPQLLGALLQAQLSHPHTDGAGGDQDHLMALSMQVGEHPGQVIHAAQVDAAVGPGEGGGAHLHDQSYLLFHVMTPFLTLSSHLRWFT